MSLLSGSTPRKKKRGGSRVLPTAVSGEWKAVIPLTGRPSIYKGRQWLSGGQNVFIPNGDLGGTTNSRPPLTRMGSIQLGSGSNRNGQAVYNHTRPDATHDRLLFAGGKVYTWNGDISSPSVTDITPGGASISATARIYCCTFAGLLVVTDGVNEPWTYDPATTTVTTIDIDGLGTAWKAYGPPVVYGGKLMFILAEKGGTVFASTFTWSEEADPHTGYYQTGFTNFWTLFQTSADRLTCLAATNAGLYYFRPDSTGFITGTVNAAFRTTAQHDSISSTVGTISPASVCVVDETVYFVDSLGRPWRITANGLEELWRMNRAEAGDPRLLDMDEVTTTYLPEARLVLMDVVPVGEPSGWRSVWDVATGRYFGTWKMPTECIRAMGTLRDSTGAQCTVMIGRSDLAGGLDVEGYVYRYRISSSSADVADTFDDDLWDADNADAYRSVSVVLGDDLEHHQRFTRVVAEVWNHTGLATTQYHLRTQIDAEAAATSTTNTLPSFKSDRVTWGTNVFGRVLNATVDCRDPENVTVRFARILADRIDEGYHPDSA